MWTKERPSPKYAVALAEAKAVHAGGKLYDGMRTFKSLAPLERLCKTFEAKTLLDYGCGRGRQYGPGPFTVKLWDSAGVPYISEAPSLAAALKVQSITPYDPAVEKYAAAPPKGALFDGVFSIDVLPAVPFDDLPWLLAHATSYARTFFFASLRLGVARAKKSAALTVPMSFDAWVKLMDKHLPAHITSVVRIRGADRVYRSIVRRPGEAGVFLSTEGQLVTQG